MKLLNDFYTIQEFNKTETGVSAGIKINKEHSIFEGHFPNQPVTPGVCTMQIIKELSEKWSGEKLMLKTARNVKFMAIINPELNEKVQFEIQFEQIEDDELSVKSTVSIDENPALKFSGSFQKI